jgi:hypothetical protein
MSKSYSKNIKIGFCGGKSRNNTEYYDQKRKIFKAKDKQTMKNTLAHVNIEDFDDVFESHNEVFKDSWSEPTDGTITFTKDNAEKAKDWEKVYLTKDKKFKK